MYKVRPSVIMNFLPKTPVFKGKRLINVVMCVVMEYHFPPYSDIKVGEDGYQLAVCQKLL